MAHYLIILLNARNWNIFFKGLAEHYHAVKSRRHDNCYGNISSRSILPKIDNQVSTFIWTNGLANCPNLGVWKQWLWVLKLIFIWDKVLKNGPSKNMWKTAFKKFEGIWSASSNFLKTVFHKFYLVHSGVLCPIWRMAKVCPVIIHLHPFFTPWKHQKALRFSDVFRE